MICLLLLLLTYKVQTPSGIIEIPSEEYVAGVVAGESSIFRSDESLKAMAIAARTYAARMKGRHAHAGFDFCSTTHCQRYISASARSTKAAQATAGQLLWFNGKPAFTVYSRSCGGKTEAVSAVWPDIDAPYLTSHADPYCSRDWTWAASTEQISHALLQAGLQAPAHLHSISAIRRTASGRAQTLSLDGELLSASSFRFAIGRFINWSAVRSEQYSIENSGDRVVFRGSGEGHGVGLCQMGADQMGVSGKSYREILAFYYPGTSLRAGDLHWTRFSGQGVVLYTLLPDTDASLIASAEKLIEKWRERLPWPPPASVEIYAYPDLDTFRNATGEPGWVAARTSGNKIELQPVSVLRSRNALVSTLEHELVHCFVESAARPGLPVWFREGLVEYLTRYSSQETSNLPDDANLRQRTDRAAAEKAYRDAANRVQTLVRRYGETAVLSWVSRGLPAEVKNSSASNPAVNNK
jgi:stage II sporulation protein D